MDGGIDDPLFRLGSKEAADIEGAEAAGEFIVEICRGVTWEGPDLFDGGDGHFDVAVGFGFFEAHEEIADFDRAAREFGGFEGWGFRRVVRGSFLGSREGFGLRKCRGFWGLFGEFDSAYGRIIFQAAADS